MNIKFIKKNRSKILSLIFLFVMFLLITMFYYSGIEKIYFQQDEWFKTGKSIYYLYSNFGSLFTRRFGFHYYPLLNLLFIAQYLVFKMNTSLYMYTSLLLQGLVGVVVYVFFKKLFSSKFVAFVLTFLFMINPGTYQVVLNEMVSTSYKIPLLLMLVMFIILFNTIQKQGKFPYKILIILSALYILSVAFFEGALIMIILLPVFFLLFKTKKTYFEFNKKNIYILILLIFLTCARLILQNLLPVDAPLPIEGSFLVSTLYNATTTPFKFIAEYLLNLDNIFTLGRFYEQKNISSKK